MIKALRWFAGLAVLGACAASIAPGDAVKDLAPTGRLRAAINYGNPVLAQKDPATGEPRGVSVDLARELSWRLRVPLEIVPFDAAGKVTAGAASPGGGGAFVALHPPRADGTPLPAPPVLHA